MSKKKKGLLPEEISSGRCFGPMMPAEIMLKNRTYESLSLNFIPPAS